MADAIQSVMSVLAPRLVHKLCDLLEADEREAVQGDLTELRVTDARALREVLGLIARRQAALWREWRPWLALAGLAVPLGILIGHVSRWWADGSAIYAFLYVNDWTWSFLTNPGARHDLLGYTARLLIDDIALAGWAWTSGFVLGSLSRQTRWMTATLFCLIVFGASSWTTTARANAFNTAVFSQTFYAGVYPWLVLIILVVLPALWGLSRSRPSSSLPLVPMTIAAVAIVALTASTARAVEDSLIFWHMRLAEAGADGIVGTADDPRPLAVRLLPFLTVWPTVYMVVNTYWQCWLKRTLPPPSES